MSCTILYYVVERTVIACNPLAQTEYAHKNKNIWWYLDAIFLTFAEIPGNLFIY